MRRRFIICVAFGLGLFALASGLFPSASVATAQQPRPATPPAGFRRLVPGTEITIPPDRQASETFSHQDLVEIKIGIADQIGGQLKSKSVPDTRLLRFLSEKTEFRRSVWCLEFIFKSPRMITVDYPGEGGKLQQKVIWYMVYRVRNTGSHLVPKQNQEGTWDVAKQDQLTAIEEGQEKPVAISIVPTFSLETLDKKKAYLDRLISVAMEPIRLREDPNRKLLNSVEMTAVTIPLSTPQKDNSVWGVAMWEDLDPRIDNFSIYVGGLSNAYRFSDPPGAFKKGDAPGTGRVFETKFLKLNFWRPSDGFTAQETEIYFGIPFTNPDTGEKTVIDHEWVFR